MEHPAAVFWRPSPALPIGREQLLFVGIVYICAEFSRKFFPFDDILGPVWWYFEVQWMILWKATDDTLEGNGWYFASNGWKQAPFSTPFKPFTASICIIASCSLMWMVSCWALNFSIEVSFVLKDKGLKVFAHPVASFFTHTLCVFTVTFWIIVTFACIKAVESMDFCPIGCAN